MSNFRAFPLQVSSALLLALAMAGCNKKPLPKTGGEGDGRAASGVHYAQVDAADSGTVAGTIHFAGKAPERIAIDMAQDPACGQSDSTPNMTQQVVVHNGDLANVFVYVKDGLGNRVYMPTKTPVVLDQKGCRYVPHVVGAMVGQPIEFRNSDPTMHNVHVVPQDGQNAAGLDISQPPMGGTQQHAFRHTGLMVPVRCNNHPWMEAYLNIVNNPFFAVSGANGKFTIGGLPPGTYTLVAVQEKLGTETKTVTVQKQKTTQADFTFPK